MVHTENNITLLIASRQFLCRFGIKTMISVIGIEPEIIEANSYAGIRDVLKNNHSVNYIIISDDVLSEPKSNNLEHLQSMQRSARIMVISPDFTCNDSSLHILKADNQKETLESLQAFFKDSDASKDPDVTGVLSEREVEVLKAVAQGYSNKEIAEKLFISANTVITHRKNITEKLGIKTIAGLTVYAIMKKIIEPDDVRM